MAWNTVQHILANIEYYPNLLFVLNPGPELSSAQVHWNTLGKFQFFPSELALTAIFAPPSFPKVLPILFWLFQASEDTAKTVSSTSSRAEDKQPRPPHQGNTQPVSYFSSISKAHKVLLHFFMLISWESKHSPWQSHHTSPSCFCLYLRK